MSEPVKIVVNGETRQIGAACRVSDLLDELGLTARPVAVEVNRELVPRAEHADCLLKSGDQLEIVTLVGGG